ncbi:LysR family transcriptional regulator [Zhihengliuella halotolerans]|uniref:DNA-binding transcriptional LysR family regulator n=1 Tax=Zhihengliuella halotolerans TaxID=370736 RepID=A0A4Q8AGC2_9MICC|nr:LysR family transcriptional regulator [Zhihengliuella halotolerans]RZU63324.1 DNA-binding transcriptional LysR family regulator [Zhihengliuella halotolerans]
MIDHRLTTLRAFASCGTIAATAELTGYSPSAVSAQLRELQNSLGMRLLVKEGRGLQLTSAGRSLVLRSDALVAEWERIKATAMSESGEAPTDFGLGGFSTAASNLLVPLAADMRRTRPEVRVHVAEASPSRCLELLAAERIDLAVVVATEAEASLGSDARFQETTLLNDPLDVMIPADHEHAGRESISLTELAGEAWISDAVGTPYRSLFAAAFTAVGVTPRVEHEATEWETATALVGAGMGLGLIPRLASLGGAENVTRLPISGLGRPTRRIVATIRRGTEGAPLIADSLGFLRTTARRLLSERLDEST